MASVLSYFNNIVFEKYNERGPKYFPKILTLSINTKIE